MLPEVDRDQLDGAIKETKSSNSYIERVVTTLKGEVYGLNGEIVDVGQSDVYAPHKMCSDPTESITDKSLPLIKSDKGTEKITHRHSAFGSRIVHHRKLKKAA